MANALSTRRPGSSAALTHRQRIDEAGNGALEMFAPVAEIGIVTFVLDHRRRERRWGGHARKGGRPWSSSPRSRHGRDTLPPAGQIPLGRSLASAHGAPRCRPQTPRRPATRLPTVPSLTPAPAPRYPSQISIALPSGRADRIKYLSHSMGQRWARG